MKTRDVCPTPVSYSQQWNALSPTQSAITYDTDIELNPPSPEFDAMLTDPSLQLKHELNAATLKTKYRSLAVKLTSLLGVGTNSQGRNKPHLTETPR